MPRPSLRPNVDRFIAQTHALQDLVGGLDELDPRHRKLIAEIILIRLCLSMENSVAEICAKLVCGAEYINGSTPVLAVQRARSTSAAFALMKSYNRSKTLPTLRWGRTKDIRWNMRMALSPTDGLFDCLLPYGSFLTELRQVRNHIAHGTEVTAKEFRKAVRRRYGALRRGMTPGLFLLTKAVTPRSKLDEYIIGSRVFISDLVRA